jgi:hypothetical protein
MAKGAHGTKSGPGKILPLPLGCFCCPLEVKSPKYSSLLPPSPLNHCHQGSLGITRLPARVGDICYQGRVGETYPHPQKFNGNSTLEAGPWPSPFCAAVAAGCTRDDGVSSPAEAQQPCPPPLQQQLSSHTLFGFCDSTPKPAHFLCEGRLPQLAPAPTLSWVALSRGCNGSN